MPYHNTSNRIKSKIQANIIFNVNHFFGNFDQKRQQLFKLIGLFWPIRGAFFHFLTIFLDQPTEECNHSHALKSIKIHYSGLWNALFCVF